METLNALVEGGKCRAKAKLSVTGRPLRFCGRGLSDDRYAYGSKLAQRTRDRERKRKCRKGLGSVLWTSELSWDDDAEVAGRAVSARASVGGSRRFRPRSLLIVTVIQDIHSYAAIQGIKREAASGSLLLVKYKSVNLHFAYFWASLYTWHCSSLSKSVLDFVSLLDRH